MPSPVSEWNNMCCLAQDADYYGHLHQHYNDTSQVCCNHTKGFPSPSTEYNNNCCGRGASAHYDDTKQICCNEWEGIPSSRNDSYTLSDLVPFGTQKDCKLTDVNSIWNGLSATDEWNYVTE